MGSGCKTIMWFRRDLRIEDNPALASAAMDGGVFAVFIWCPEEEGQFYPGRLSRWWLKQSLIHLDKSLRSLGAELKLIKTQSTISSLLECVHSVGAKKVVFNHLYDPISIHRDHDIKQKLGELDIAVQSYNGDLLHEPWEIHDDDGHAFTMFDMYWKKCLSMQMEPFIHLPPIQLLPAEESYKVRQNEEEYVNDMSSSHDKYEKTTGLFLCMMAGLVNKCTIEELGLDIESEKDSDAILGRRQSPGWSNANKVLNEFVENHLLDYLNERNKVVRTSTSFLSPYLHFGELSVRKVYQSVHIKKIQWAEEKNATGEESAALYLRSIGLRDYSRYICFNFPYTHERPLVRNLNFFPWNTDDALFKAWRQGRTGYPLVDAGMRELWATGWIHSRIQVIVSSFLVKFLILPWQWGLKYFWDTLLDADLEYDILFWQYISGSLPDGLKLERLDSPQVQGFKYDPEGEYVRQWLPELARLPVDWIHHPWNAPPNVLKSSGVELGVNYPKPIVDIDTARDRLTEAIFIMRATEAAAKAADSNWSDEVVFENYDSIDEDVLKLKTACPATSSEDQRVPSRMQMENVVLKKKRPNPVGAKGKLQIQEVRHNNAHDLSGVVDDLSSTAESTTKLQTTSSSNSLSVPQTSNQTTIEPCLHECSCPKKQCKGEKDMGETSSKTVK